MHPVEYRETDIAGIELIRPLWIQLNRHHHANARVFQEVYARWTFDECKVYFATVTERELLRIDLGYDPGRERYAGYCVSSLSEDRAGENESI